MNSNNVTVCGDAVGNVIGISSKNPEWGYIRVEQKGAHIAEGGWLKTIKKSSKTKRGPMVPFLSSISKDSILSYLPPP